MKLVLVRHGETAAIQDGVTGGWLNTPLSFVGIEKLKKMRDTLAYPKTNHYFTSTMLRAMQTFGFLYPNIKCEKRLENFKEHGMGKYEGQIFSEDFSIYTHWLLDQGDESEEQFSVFQNRVVTGLYHLYQKYPDDSMTIVCHAGVIRAVIMYLNDMEPMDYLKMHPKNGMAYVIEVHDEQGRLKSTGFSLIDGSSIYDK